MENNDILMINGESVICVHYHKYWPHISLLIFLLLISECTVIRIDKF